MAFAPVTTVLSKSLCANTVILGSPTVLAGLYPVSRLFVDLLLHPAVILGPGNPLVLVNFLPVSRMFDFITPHVHPFPVPHLPNPIFQTKSLLVWV
jgi:hypothetical protein